jgi:hypothetical protein
MGIEISDPREKMMLMMTKAWRNGISPREFRRNMASDMRNVIDISEAIDEKASREAVVRARLAGARGM